MLSSFLELKISWILQEVEQSIVETRLSTFIDMESALLSEKTYYEFFIAFRTWVPKICKFTYACIILYDEKCIF